ncbi:hypothetical protein ACFU5O_24650 [Streptomyces sp. NPDC057445]|uniref:hypothetical protein n=1 Tax=Streptomyces sp. NPDC057445 TaxID=3346136 RepID=UPI00369A5C88
MSPGSRHILSPGTRHILGIGIVIGIAADDPGHLTPAAGCFVPEPGHSMAGFADACLLHTGGPWDPS